MLETGMVLSKFGGPKFHFVNKIHKCYEGPTNLTCTPQTGRASSRGRGSRRCLRTCCEPDTGSWPRSNGTTQHCHWTQWTSPPPQCAFIIMTEGFINHYVITALLLLRINYIACRLIFAAINYDCDNKRSERLCALLALTASLVHTVKELSAQ